MRTGTNAYSTTSKHIYGFATLQGLSWRSRKVRSSAVMHGRMESTVITNEILFRFLRHNSITIGPQTRRQQLSLLRHESRINPSQQITSRHLRAKDSRQYCQPGFTIDGVGNAVQRGEEGSRTERLEVGAVGYR